MGDFNIRKWREFIISEDLPVQLTTNISTQQKANTNMDADGDNPNRKIPRYIYIDKSAIPKLNEYKGGPHLKLISQDGKNYKLLVSEMLAIALTQVRRGRAPVTNNLLKRFMELFPQSVFRGNLKNSLVDSSGNTIQAQETPFGKMITSTLQIAKSKKSGEFFAKFPMNPIGGGDKIGVDPIFE